MKQTASGTSSGKKSQKWDINIIYTLHPSGLRRIGFPSVTVKTECNANASIVELCRTVGIWDIEL